MRWYSTEDYCVDPRLFVKVEQHEYQRPYIYDTKNRIAFGLHTIKGDFSKQAKFGNLTLNDNYSVYCDKIIEIENEEDRIIIDPKKQKQLKLTDAMLQEFGSADNKWWIDNITHDILEKRIKIKEEKVNEKRIEDERRLKSALHYYYFQMDKCDCGNYLWERYRFKSAEPRDMDGIKKFIKFLDEYIKEYELPYFSANDEKIKSDKSELYKMKPLGYLTFTKVQMFNFLLKHYFDGDSEYRKRDFQTTWGLYEEGEKHNDSIVHGFGILRIKTSAKLVKSDKEVDEKIAIINNDLLKRKKEIKNREKEIEKAIGEKEKEKVERIEQIKKDLNLKYNYGDGYINIFWNNTCTRTPRIQIKIILMFEGYEIGCDKTHYDKLGYGTYQIIVQYRENYQSPKVLSTYQINLIKG